MEQELQVKVSEPVEPDKFDRHMKKARQDDLEARRSQYIIQGVAQTQRDQRICGIIPSVY